MNSDAQDSLSTQRGIPLGAEPGLGPLTLPAYLRSNHEIRRA
jgi:hypothetical protein